MTPRAALDRGLGELALALPANAGDKLIAYLELLAKWNKTYNLTAIRDSRRAVSVHLLDSLAVLRELPAGPLADVVSGGGLPGIPLAIADAARPVTLNDSNAKKGAFLRQAIIELGLDNAAVHVGRVEEWRPQERFGVVIARGFASLAGFAASCRHLAAPSGVLAAMKGEYPRDELAALPGCVASDVRKLRVPLLEAERHLVFCRVRR
jgi:16S rRNA (guanine527-N7)-methyltransferase